jgi:hypothetical protein
VSDGTNGAACTDVANSPLLGHIAFQHTGALATNNTYSYEGVSLVISFSVCGLECMLLDGIARAHERARRHVPTISMARGYPAFTTFQWLDFFVSDPVVDLCFCAFASSRIDS